MERFEYGDPDAPVVLIQPVGDHDLPLMEKEASLIREMCGRDFRLVALKTEDWNKDLSPWKAPAVFGNDDFGGGAEETLKEVLAAADDPAKKYYIGGYSLAGLFALWGVYQTDIFSGAAAASPSLWFPGFVSYMKTNELRADRVYLSLGDREEKARNPVMASVGSCIREANSLLNENGVDCVLEWNEGNHFRDPEIRTAKAFAWVMREP
ncbi:MAG: esterase [Lachnospiraceae bacterium]|nr:esterase [Lachnospiraceae bacterium]